MQGGVAGGGGGVGAGFVVQQQLHQLLVTHSGRTVQGRLVVLAQQQQERHSQSEFGANSILVTLGETFLSCLGPFMSPSWGHFFEHEIKTQTIVHNYKIFKFSLHAKNLKLKPSLQSLNK